MVVERYVRRVRQRSRERRGLRSVAPRRCNGPLGFSPVDAEAIRCYHGRTVLREPLPRTGLVSCGYPPPTPMAPAETVMPTPNRTHRPPPGHRHISWSGDQQGTARERRRCRGNSCGCPVARMPSHCTGRTPSAPTQLTADGQPAITGRPSWSGDHARTATPASPGSRRGYHLCTAPALRAVLTATARRPQSCGANVAPRGHAEQEG
jgi:hypothetical protein